MIDSIREQTIPTAPFTARTQRARIRFHASTSSAAPSEKTAPPPPSLRVPPAPPVQADGGQTVQRFAPPPPAPPVPAPSKTPPRFAPPPPAPPVYLSPNQQALQAKQTAPPPSPVDIEA